MSRHQGRLLRPLPLAAPEKLVQRIKRLGIQLHAFVKACNDLYALSMARRQPSWVASLVNQGIPERFADMARHKALRNRLPALIRPELVLTGGELLLRSLTFTPTDLGRAALLQNSAARQGFAAVGGDSGITSALIKKGQPTLLLVPDMDEWDQRGMEWLAAECGSALAQPVISEEIEGRIREPEAFHFFSGTPSMHSTSGPENPQFSSENASQISQCIKPYLEEKIWFPLLQLRSLRGYWRRSLSDRHFEALLRITPRSWVLDPAPLPPQAEVPGLGIRSFKELEPGRFPGKSFSVLPSRTPGGSSEQKHAVLDGARDASGWKVEIHRALECYPNNPHILQENMTPEVFNHEFQDDSSREIISLETHIRLRPYFFSSEGGVELGGLLAGFTSRTASGAELWESPLWTPVVSGNGNAG